MKSKKLQNPNVMCSYNFNARGNLLNDHTLISLRGCSWNEHLSSLLNKSENSQKKEEKIHLQIEKILKEKKEEMDGYQLMKAKRMYRSILL